ncbi:MAG: hypothetical protein ACRDSZ_13185, partial [Pseudonocardiaceae bacterium]
HDNRTDATTFLAEAEESAHRLGQDANYLWTAFGPTNVAIHRVSAAMELGDVQVAIPHPRPGDATPSRAIELGARMGVHRTDPLDRP